jgi:hypothetical protein
MGFRIPWEKVRNKVVSNLFMLPESPPWHTLHGFLFICPILAAL